MQAYPIDLFGHKTISDTRQCTSCKLFKTLNKFRVGTAQGKKTPRRWSECRECLSKRCRNYHKANPGRMLEIKLMKNYGMTLTEFNSLLEDQKGLCAICHMPEPAIDKRTGKQRRLSVDHSHQTGKTRGLLCTLCNQGIGQFRENPELLMAAIEYIKKHNDTQAGMLTSVAKTPCRRRSTQTVFNDVS